MMRTKLLPIATALVLLALFGTTGCASRRPVLTTSVGEAGRAIDPMTDTCEDFGCGG